MGDRANVVIRGKYGDDIWLYTHSFGSDLKDIVKKALARKQRWDDPAYLTRIIFSEMLKYAGALDTEYGFGISTFLLDNEHGVIVVDVPNQKVVRMEERNLEKQLRNSLTVQVLPKVLDYRVSRTFEQFAANGFKAVKRVERRKGWDNRRGTKGPSEKGARRKNDGRRKDD